MADGQGTPAQASERVRLIHGAADLAGLTDPHVSIRLAQAITGDPKTGKVSRFILMRRQPAQPRQAAR
jgi:hypothetical protein